MASPGSTERKAARRRKPRQATVQVFDVSRFINDVEKIRQRWNWNERDVFDFAGLGRSSLVLLATGKRALTLYVACRLASAFDLDLNSYNMVESS